MTTVTNETNLRGVSQALNCDILYSIGLVKTIPRQYKTKKIGPFVNLSSSVQPTFVDVG